MTLEQAKNEIPDFETYAKICCDNCSANDWYCPSYCPELEKASRIPFDIIQKKYAQYDGDLRKVVRYIKNTKRRYKNMTRGFEAVCTNDEAREHFKECGLTYSDITEGDILSLVLMINRELKKSNKIGETSVNTMSLSKKIDITKNTNGTIKSCFLYLSSHYFTRREAISFNQDGFISFAGWADDGNLNPLKRAFLAWCDELKSERDGKK